MDDKEYFELVTEIEEYINRIRVKHPEVSIVLHIVSDDLLAPSKIVKIGKSVLGVIPLIITDMELTKIQLLNHYQRQSKFFEKYDK